MDRTSIKFLLRLWFVAILFILGALTGCTPDSAPTELQAVASAETRLSSFAFERGIMMEDFQRTRVRFDQETRIWQVDYDQIKPGGLLVTILVKSGGAAEVTFTQKD